MSMFDNRKRMMRHILNAIFTVLCYISVAVGIVVLASTMYTLFSKGIPAINLSLFIKNLPPLGSDGGLKNAILGSLIITGAAVIISAPIGILIATNLTEFPSKGRLGSAVRIVNDILLSAPSIIIGLFVYSIVVRALGHFSALAGIIALALIAIPMIVRTSEDVMKIIPTNLREAAVSLGVPRWKETIFVIYKTAKAGLITGVILAMARVAGETAPLLFTVLNNQFPNYNVANVLPAKVRMLNKEGKIVTASYDSFYSTVKKYDWNSRSLLIGEPGESSWPVIGLTYLIAKKDKMNKELSSFIEFMIKHSAAREKAKEMGYALPSEALYFEVKN